jgi:hypothetical protein
MGAASHPKQALLTACFVHEPSTRERGLPGRVFVVCCAGVTGIRGKHAAVAQDGGHKLLANTSDIHKQPASSSHHTAPSHSHAGGLGSLSGSWFQSLVNQQYRQATAAADRWPFSQLGEGDEQCCSRTCLGGSARPAARQGSSVRST